MTARNDELTGPSAGARFDAGVREAVPVLVDGPVDGPADEIELPRLGPESLIWKFYGDHRTQFFGFQRVAGVENCIEQLGQGVLDHSVIFSDTLGRAKRTGPPLMKTVYSDDPHKWGRTVRDFHQPIKGTVSDGSRYHALNPELFYWAHATFVDQVIYNTDMFIRRLSREEKEQIFNEGKIWYSLYGVSDRGQPQTYDDFVAYWDDMCERFVPHKTVLYGTGYIRKGIPGPRRIPKPVWKILSAPLNAYTRLVLVGTLPPRMREVCELEWDTKKETRFQRFAAVMRALNPLITRLPLWFLYTPWAAEVSGHALRILFSGVFDRHPGATLILGHMGEFLPFQRSRLDSRYATLATLATTALKRMPSEYLGTNIVFTNSGVFSPAVMLGTVLEVGADALMFSVDYPYESSYQAVKGFEQTTLSATDREKIAHGNAERLLRIS